MPIDPDDPLILAPQVACDRGANRSTADSHARIRRSRVRLSGRVEHCRPCPVLSPVPLLFDWRIGLGRLWDAPVQTLPHPYNEPLRAKGFAIAFDWHDTNPMANDIVVRLALPRPRTFPAI